ncbi:MAG: hypothetical protein ACRDNZ_18450 [Streptosporangiaceae bacterium]
MGMVANLRAIGTVVRRTRLDRTPDAARLLARRPAIALAVGVFETGLVASGRMPARLKALATIKTSALVGCPF